MMDEEKRSVSSDRNRDIKQTIESNDRVDDILPSSENDTHTKQPIDSNAKIEEISAASDAAVVKQAVENNSQMDEVSVSSDKIAHVKQPTENNPKIDEMSVSSDTDSKRPVENNDKTDEMSVSLDESTEIKLPMNKKIKIDEISVSSDSEDLPRKRRHSRDHRRRSRSPRKREGEKTRDRHRHHHHRRHRSSSPRRKERKREKSPTRESRRKSRRRSPSSSSESEEEQESKSREEKRVSAARETRRSRFSDKPPSPVEGAGHIPGAASQSSLIGLGGSYALIGNVASAPPAAVPAAPPVPPAMNPSLSALLSSALTPAPAPVPTVPKEHKELFIGNIPPGTTDVVLTEFITAAMRQVRMAGPGEIPIVTCRMNPKFAFIECRTVEATNNCLNLNGIPFMGQMLKIGRPAKYSGPNIPALTWQQLTGQNVATVALPPPVTTDETTKKFRELFVGNTSPEMTEIALREFIGGAMHKMGLTFAPDNPILNVRLNGRFAFVELRTIEEASNCLNLNGIPFLGSPLKISRPSKYDGPQIPFFEWDALLSRWLSGELKLTTAGTASRALKLSNMVTPETLVDADAREEVVEDTKEECTSFGTVNRVLIPRTEDGAYAAKGVGKVYVEMSTEEEAKAALLALKGRTFDGRVVDVKFFPAEQLATSPPNFTDPPTQVITSAGPLPVDVITGNSTCTGLVFTPSLTTSTPSPAPGITSAVHALGTGSSAGIGTGMSVYGPGAGVASVPMPAAVSAVPSPGGGGVPSFSPSLSSIMSSAQPAAPSTSFTSASQQIITSLQGE